MSKLTSLNEAVGKILDGSMIAIGGNVLHRTPIAAVTELIVQNKKRLHIVKTAGAHDVDLLCSAECIDDVTFGFISYEPPYNLCRFFRKAVESGRTRAHENACYTVIMGLRAAAYGLSFIPTRGLDGSDLVEANQFKMVTDPYTGLEYVALRAIKPDYAIIHVQEADENGNCKINGPLYEDTLMARAARNVIITAERIVESEVFKADPGYADIPGNLVTAVIEVPYGAVPGTCAGQYSINDNLMRTFKGISTDGDTNEYIRKLRNSIGLHE